MGKTSDETHLREFIAPSPQHQLVREGETRHGVVIGIDEYADTRLNLRYAVADARAMFDLMVDEGCGVFPRENVTLLLNEQATTREVGLALSSLAQKIDSNDMVWIYFAGHGAVEGDEAYWVTHDAAVNHLSTTGLKQSTIDDELSRLVRACRRVVLLLDCCHAAATALQTYAVRAMPSAEELFPKFNGEGITMLAASAPSEKSVEIVERNRGAFTYYLEKGLRGEADDEGNRDRVVTFEELWKYVEKKVRAEASRVHIKQTPVKHVKMTGDDTPLTVNSWTEFAVRGIVYRMRWIAPGTFSRGSPANEKGRFRDEVQHRVKLTQGFWLGQTPVTQGLWQAVMEENPSHFKDPNRPVERVNWEDCQVFIERLNERFPPGGFRLPTEAEWEYACRAGTTTATWVDDLKICGEYDAPLLDAIAWYGGNCGVDFDINEWCDTAGWKQKQYPDTTKGGTRRVQSKAPNPWWLHDMLGNVWEWCADWCGDYRVDDECDPQGPATGALRVLRGGSWASRARSVRAAARLAGTPYDRCDDFGFRLARSPVQSSGVEQQRPNPWGERKRNGRSA